MSCIGLHASLVLLSWQGSFPNQDRSFYSDAVSHFVQLLCVLLHFSELVLLLGSRLHIQQAFLSCVSKYASVCMCPAHWLQVPSLRWPSSDVCLSVRCITVNQSITVLICCLLHNLNLSQSVTSFVIVTLKLLSLTIST